jgi:diacylglycerol kinase family enzyme
MIDVQSAQPMLVQADGELLGEAPARFEVLPAALTVAI